MSPSISNCGYILGGFQNGKSDLNRLLSPLDIEAQLKSLSTCTVERISDPSHQLIASPIDDKVTALTVNMLHRGLPTLASPLVEECIANSLKVVKAGLVKEQQTQIRFAYSVEPTQSDEFKRFLVQAAHPIDPRLSLEDFPTEDLYGSKTEKMFHQGLRKYNPNSALPFLLELQRPLEETVGKTNQKEIVEQRLDFAIEQGNLKIAIEVDGPTHEQASQQLLDSKRESLLTQNNWETLRLSAKEAIHPDFGQLPGLANIAASPSLEPFNQHIRHPLWATPLGQDAMKVVLAPIAIARLQLAVMDAVKNHSLTFQQTEWRILVVERDVSCAAVAMDDLWHWFQDVLALLAIEGGPPKILLDVCNTPEFVAGNVPPTGKAPIQVTTIPIAKLGSLKSKYYDLVIDISMMAYSGYKTREVAFLASFAAPSGRMLLIRNKGRLVDGRKINRLPQICYPIPAGKNQIQDDALTSILQRFFRKWEYRGGQLAIIKRALSLQPVIGLLPTGAGKSITFQLSALLQPGTSLVITPLKSLMLDQVENLRTFYRIDKIGSISSDDTTDERNERLEDFAEGKYAILYLTPERLQTPLFRTKLVNFAAKCPIPYLVIDEAHCVSEWGHDFRTSYLRMSKTIEAFAKHKDQAPVPLALTGTASLVVLTDIQREIGISDPDARVYPENFIREELVHSVEKINTKEKWARLEQFLLGYYPKTTDALPAEAPKSAPAGIVFALHVNGKFGVFSETIGSLKSKLSAEVGQYSGSAPKDFIDSDFNKLKKQTQKDFTDGKIDLLVATKSFGMGIDKPDIRFTIHLNLPQSMESYYQEAGRAGRDKKESKCVILFSDDNPEDAEIALSLESDDETRKALTGKPKNGACDISRLLYFHLGAYIGVEMETLVFSSMYKTKIEPFLGLLNVGEQTIKDIPHKLALPKDGFPQNRVEHIFITQNSAVIDKELVEKMIYRMSIMGIVEDYTVDFGKQQFQLFLRAIDDDTLIENIQTYIERYAGVYENRNYRAEIENQPGQNLFEKAFRYLITFVYENIEKKRRRAIYNMRDIALRVGSMRDAAQQNASMQKWLNDFFTTTPFTDLFEKSARQFDPVDVNRVLLAKDDTNKLVIDSGEGLRQLFTGASRILEDYVEAPVPLVLRGISNAALGGRNQDQPLADISTAINLIYRDHKQQASTFIDQTVSAIRRVVKDADVQGRMVREVLIKAYSKDPSREVARQAARYDEEISHTLLLNYYYPKINQLSNTLKETLQ